MKIRTAIGLVINIAEIAVAIVVVNKAKKNLRTIDAKKNVVIKIDEKDCKIA